MRLLARAPEDAMVRALTAGEEAARVEASVPRSEPLGALARWADGAGDRSLAEICGRFAGRSRVGAALVLAGPTGERNVYTLHPRQAVLCLADDERDRLVQLAAVLAVGSRALWPDSGEALHRRLPDKVQQSIDLTAAWTADGVRFDAVLHHGNAADLLRLLGTLAERPGPIVAVDGLRPGDTSVALERLVVERAVSINTAAAGGNATLMTLE
jgi:RHH-type proline utilization regulon transcriptional repressor/proline dehydrogenase/delta 1-pyrroline-5-carboxylate dehydrogenase